MSPEALVALSGLTSVSDWIASSRAEATYAGPDVDLDAYVTKARQDEIRRVEQLAWAPWVPPQRTGFRALFPTESEPHPMQRAVERVVSQMDGPGIVVVSAPTGEGKTKAALQAAATMVQRFHLAGFYVAMPSRVTSNQAFDVADELLVRLEGSPRLRLLHSASADHLKPTNVDADGPADGDDQAQEWFTHKRGLLAPLGVGTVDQALMAALRTSHVFVRLTGLSNKVVVFDEVHGYDVHMSTLLDRLLWWLGKLHVPVVLLSATLPSHRQQALVDSWRTGALGRRPEPTTKPHIAADYPRVTWAGVKDDRPRKVVAAPSRLNRDRVIDLVRVETDDHIAWALEQAAQERCVAVVHNVVRHAVSAYQELEQRVAKLPPQERPEIFLLHGRLAQAERVRAEAKIRERFGRPDDSGADKRRPARAVVVGTQLLEQGLDADFDVMVSAVAPVDSLIQRMGRIQRHARGTDRPPRLLALTGVEEQRTKVAFLPYTVRVYAEAVLLRSWTVLRDRTQIRCPDEVQQLVDAVYGEPSAVTCPPGWQRQWARAEESMRRDIARHEQGARAVRLPQPRGDLQLWELTTRATSARRTREQNHQRDDDRG